MAGLAYTFGRSGTGWAWSICDAAGVTLAAGAAASQDQALQALELTLRAAARIGLRPPASASRR